MKIRFACLCLIACCLLTVSAQAAEKNDIVSIGVIAPLTGHIAAVGETLKNTVLLADADFDKQDRVRFIIEDDNFLPRNSATIAQRMIKQEKVAAIIMFGSNTSLAVSPITEAQGVPLLTMALAKNVTLGKKHAYRFFISTDDVAHSIAERAKELGYRSIAAVTTTQDGMLAMRDQVEKSLPTPYVLNEEVMPGDSDMKSLAVRIKKAAPSAVFMALLSPQLAAFSRQMRDIGYQGDLFSGPQIQYHSEIKAAQGALKDTWFTGPDDSMSTEFYRRYEEKFGGPPAPDGIYGYDSARLMILAAEQGNVGDFLAKQTAFDSVVGHVTREASNYFKAPVIVKFVRGEGFGFK